eukprot:SAG11_NODE_22853_length_399_cov_0.673333_1_plen_44_part_00
MKYDEDVRVMGDAGVWRGAFRFDTIGPAAAGAVYLRMYLVCAG